MGRRVSVTMVGGFDNDIRAVGSWPAHGHFFHMLTCPLGHVEIMEGDGGGG
jgi:hypothetical protein